MTSRQWADEIIANLKRIQGAAQEASQAYTPLGISATTYNAQPQKLDGRAIAVALAEYLKNDNPTTQAIAIRASNLSQKYPQRAY